jgi:hypothetical protein
MPRQNSKKRAALAVITSDDSRCAGFCKPLGTGCCELCLVAAGLAPAPKRTTYPTDTAHHLPVCHTAATTTTAAAAPLVPQAHCPCPFALHCSPSPSFLYPHSGCASFPPSASRSCLQACMPPRRCNTNATTYLLHLPPCPCPIPPPYHIGSSLCF